MIFKKPHIFKWMQPKKAAADKLGYTTASKAGFYVSKEWRQLRAAYITANPLCASCRTEKMRFIAAEVVDHIIPVAKEPELALSWHNLQSLCHNCHRLKTRRDNSKYSVENKRRGKKLMNDLEN